MHTIHNARVTLFANLLNTMAGSSFTVGVAAPIAAVFFYNPAGLTRTAAFGGAAVWLLAAVALHIAAQRDCCTACYWRASHMNKLQWFALVILPAGVGVFAMIAPWLARRFIP
jgi:hypothetical protein